MVVTNEQNKIAKLELGVNEDVLEVGFPVGKQSVTWVDLPDAEKETSFTFSYKYYDNDGNEIKE